MAINTPNHTIALDELNSTKQFNSQRHIFAATGKEQAKATSEQELQTTLDYIARDLEQAVYIYDADGIAAIKSPLPSSTATNSVQVQNRGAIGVK